MKHLTGLYEFCDNDNESHHGNNLMTTRATSKNINVAIYYEGYG